MPAAGYEAPHINWTLGRELWQEGKSFKAIARAIGAAASTVEYRAKREQWARAGAALVRRVVNSRRPTQRTTYAAPAIGQPETARDQAIAPSHSERVIAGRGIRTPQTLQAVINGIANKGLAISLACDLAGVADSTLSAWRKDDPEVDAAIKAAVAERAALRIQAIDDGASTWQSRAWALARDPSTREIYGDPSHSRGSGPQVIVQLNVRNAGDLADDAVTIAVTPSA